MSSYASELTLHLRSFAERCRAARWWPALFHVNVACDILADVTTQQKQIRDTATQAEQFDVAALAEIEAATLKDSDGGPAITPKELRRIRPLIAKSATLDHQAAELSS